MTSPKVSNYAINGSGGALITIFLTIMARYVVVQEDPNQDGAVAQGLQGFYLDPLSGTPSPANLQVWLPNTAGQAGRAFEPIELGDPRTVHGPLGIPLGANGTPILQLKSFTATATGIIVAEYV